MDAQTPWHRQFGLSWVDFFHGLPVAVEMEKDLSLKQQLLDLVIIRKEAAELRRRLPDGFEDLATHNLVTFKSFQEALDGWALNELIGHYVNYRKQVSPSLDALLPETDFRLYAVCVRFPQGLAARVPLRRLQAGVYEVRHFTGGLRVVMVHELPQEEHNAMLHLFAARPDLVGYGIAHFHPHSPETSTLLYQLLERYRREEVFMPDALEELQKLYRETVQEVLKQFSPEERLKGMSVEELLAALPPETREELARRLRGNGSPSTPAGES